MAKIKFPAILLSLLIIGSIFLSVNKIGVFAEKYDSNETKTITNEFSDEENYEVSFTYLDVLEHYYSDITNYCHSLNVLVDEDVSFDAFCDTFYNQETYLLSEYCAYLKELISFKTEENSENNNLTLNDLEINIALYSGGTPGWWENIGDALPQKPNYSLNYNIKRGDILYEQGSVKHTALVAGLLYDSTYGSYWGLIEATAASGVCRSVIDDDRLAALKGVFLAVTVDITNKQYDEIYSFCERQLGKEYTIDFLGKPHGENQKWMCSTMIWSAYFNGANIDICPQSPNAYPSDIYDSPLTVTVKAGDCQYLQFKIVKSYYTFPAFWSWDIEIVNNNNFDVTVLYNERLCNEMDARRFDLNELVDVTEIAIPKNSSVVKTIGHNGTAGYAVACINLTINSRNCKMVTYANNLKYSSKDDKGSCDQYNVTLFN